MALFNWRKWFRPTPNPTPAPPITPPDGNTIEQLLYSHNEYRSRVNAQKLELNQQLNTAAQKHAEWMARNSTMSHTGAGGSQFSDRIRNEGYIMRGGGENIAAGYRSVEAVMNGWMNSTGHRRNILNASFEEVGFGMSKNYWCTVFAIPANANNITVMGEYYLPEPLDARV